MTDFYRVPAWALALTSRSRPREQRISPMGALLLGVISSYERRTDGVAYPSINELAKVMHVETRTVTGLVGELEAVGALEVQRGGGRGRRTTYAVKDDPTITDPTIGDPTNTDQVDAERVIVDGNAPLSEKRSEEMVPTAPAVAAATSKKRTPKPPKTLDAGESRVRGLMPLVRATAKAAYRRNGKPFPGGDLASNANEWRRIAAWIVDAVVLAREDAGREYRDTMLLTAIVNEMVDADPCKPVGYWIPRMTEAWDALKTRRGPSGKHVVPFERVEMREAS